MPVFAAIAGVLLLLVLAGAFVPLVTCENCDGAGYWEQPGFGNKGPVEPLVPCPHCLNRGKLSLLKRWRIEHGLWRQ